MATQVTVKVVLIPNGDGTYYVKETHNTLDPRAGTWITEAKLQKLLAQGTIHITVRAR